MQSLDLYIPGTRDTLQLGEILASKLAAIPAFALLLQGELGSGKTTLVRGLVESLPGGEQAEVSSPSFNIFNIYPTKPEVIHFDLYRLEEQGFDEGLVDYLHTDQQLVVVEWAEFLPASYWPQDYLLFNFEHTEKERKIMITAKGKNSAQFLKNCEPLLGSYLKEQK